MHQLPSPLTPEHILSEVKKLQYLYGLKREIRYGQKRPENDLTESVAEHIYGMHLLAHYFLPLENLAGDWNLSRIFTMITIHDLDEIETGDTIGYLKTPEVRRAERAAQEKVITNAPHHLQSHFRDHLNDYEAQTTIESQFVKAIDRFEPLIQMYNENGKQVFLANKQTSDQASGIKEPFIKPFPVMYSYYNTIHSQMDAEGYFYRE